MLTESAAYELLEHDARVQSQFITKTKRTIIRLPTRHTDQPVKCMVKIPR